MSASRADLAGRVPHSVRCVPMASLKRIAPIFPVSDLRASLEHYAKLGFATRAYETGEYGFATLDNVEIHLGVMPTGRSATPASAYLFVEDADQLAQRWTSAGANVRPPEDTEWGQHEGVLIDPDGNIIRFGSAMARPVLTRALRRSQP